MSLRQSHLNPLRLASSLGKGLLTSDKPPAQPPGTLIHVGEKRVDHLQLQVVEYDDTSLESLDATDIEECLRFSATPKNSWIQVTGLHEVEKIRRLGESYGIDVLVLEDILNTSSRPKIEVLDDSLFIVCKLLTFDGKRRVVDVQHFSLVLLADSTVLTFLEGPTHAFDPVRQRIETGGGGRIRQAGGDYLAWALLDAVVDHYFQVVDGVEENLADLEERLQSNPDAEEPGALFSLKKEVTALNRLLRPIREIATVLQRSDTPLLTDYSRPYFRDLQDHVIHVLELADYLREMAASLREFYLAAVSHKMNDVMKVLTSFATIFMPITFLAGIYGMNFEGMPELRWPWAYPALLGTFAVIAGTMIYLFRKKRWL